MSNARHAVALRDQAGPAYGDEYAGAWGNDRYGLAIRALQKMDLAQRLSRTHLRAKLNNPLVHARLRREAIVVTSQRLHPARGRQARRLPRMLVAVHDTEVDEHVAESALRQTMHCGGDRFSAAHF